MSTRYVCDWCYAEFDDRAKVASADVTIGGVNEQLHLCAECAPDHLKQHYPEECKPVTDGGVDVAAKAAPDESDTFRPNVPDRRRRRVRDDHAANAVLHATLKAAFGPANDTPTVNLMGSHAPGEKDHEPSYEVYVKTENTGAGHPMIPKPVRRMVDRDKAKLTGVVECSDDHLIVSIRPVEIRIEPVEIQYDDIPVVELLQEQFDSVEHDDTTIPCGCGDYAVAVPGGVSPEAIDVVCPVCKNHFGHGPAPADLCPCETDHDGTTFVDPAIVDELESLAEDYDAAAAARGEDLGEPWRRAASDIRVALDTHAADGSPPDRETTFDHGAVCIEIGDADADPDERETAKHSLGTGDRLTVEVGDQHVVVDPIGIRHIDDIPSPPTVGEDGGDE